MRTENVPQTLFQPPLSRPATLATLDGVSVGTGSNYVIYTAPARTKVVVQFFSFTNRAAAGATYVSFFLTAADGSSPRFFRYQFAVDDVAFLLCGSDELVLMPGDKLEAIAETNTVTADIVVSGRTVGLPS